MREGCEGKGLGYTARSTATTVTAVASLVPAVCPAGSAADVARHNELLELLPGKT
jgi:hypothetical protein